MAVYAHARFADFAALNAWLATRCRELGARRHPTQDATIAEIFALEQPVLQPVSMPFDAYIEQPLRVSSTGLVSVDRNRSSVPAEWTGKVVSVRISAHGIRVVADGAPAGRHQGQVRVQPADLRAPSYSELGTIAPFWRPSQRTCIPSSRA